ncbi:MAG: TRAP transporter small permease [Polyangiaceae bacterium]
MSDEKGEGTKPAEAEAKEEPAADEKKEEKAEAKAEAKSEAKAEAKPEADAEEKAASSEPPPSSKKPEKKVEAKPEPKKAAGDAKPAWGLALAKLDKKWTKLEATLCAYVLIAEIIALCIWITLKGLSAEYVPGGDRSGLVFRGLLGAVVLGLVANKLTKPKNEEDEGERKKNAYAVSSALIVGIALSFAWAKVGVEYFSNMLNWMQSASLLTLIGGLRGVATRLTLWLALLGASLATAQGKHINIDVVMRFLSPRLRIPVAVIGWVAAATMCTAGVWGFFDHIAIEAFHAPAIEPCAADANQSCDVAPGKKISFVEQAMGTDLFLVGRQISLDFSTLPKVIVGTKYSDYMKGPEWNAWLDAADWTSHFKKEDVDELRVPDDPPGQTHLPVVSIPGSPENVPGMLIKELDFVFPMGLFAIALRFILRALLVIAGIYKVDPDAVHGEEEIEEAQEEQHSKPGEKVTT